MEIYIALGVIIACLLGIVFIIARKFPSLAGIDIASLPKEQQAEVRDQILVDRFQRKTKGFFVNILLNIQPGWKFLKRKIMSIYHYFLELEKRYQKSSKEKVKDGENIDQKISRLLREAEDFLKEENFSEAEKRFIEIISLDVKNEDAYAGLGKLYFSSKDYEQAKETLEYLLKINPEVSEYYLELGEVYEELKDYEKAVKNAEKAVGLSPNNPRTLDFLIESAIMVGNKKLAGDTLKKLKEVNPENEKLLEWKDKIKEMPS